MSGGEKIAIVVGSMSVGGAQRVALNLAEEFADRGHSVDLVLVSVQGPLIQTIPANVRVVALDSSRARSSVVKLRRYLRSERPATVLSIAFHINIVTAIAAIGVRPRPRLILSVHNPISNTMRQYSLGTRSWMSVATKVLYHLADQIVVVSDGSARDIERFTGLSRERITTIYNPVIAKDFSAAVAESPAHPWAQDPSRPLLVAVGRLSKQKDYLTLIRAVAKVLMSRSDARLLILGEGEERGNLEAMIKSLGLENSVALPGQVANVLPYMRVADVFVLSSAWEGFGNVLVEAMATGTPVVSTDCPHGPREVLEDGRWGSLVPVGDERALANAILETLASGGVDASARAQDFTAEAAADRYLAVLTPTNAGREVKEPS